MRFPADGPERVAFLAELHDATVTDVCIAYAGLVARGWEPHEASRITAGWVRDRAEAVVCDLVEFAEGAA